MYSKRVTRPIEVQAEGQELISTAEHGLKGTSAREPDVRGPTNLANQQPCELFFPTREVRDRSLATRSCPRNDASPLEHAALHLRSWASGQVRPSRGVLAADVQASHAGRVCKKADPWQLRGRLRARLAAGRRRRSRRRKCGASWRRCPSTRARAWRHGRPRSRRHHREGRVPQASTAPRLQQEKPSLACDTNYCPSSLLLTPPIQKPKRPRRRYHRCLCHESEGFPDTPRPSSRRPPAQRPRTRCTGPQSSGRSKLTGSPTSCCDTKM